MVSMPPDEGTLLSVKEHPVTVNWFAVILKAALKDGFAYVVVSKLAKLSTNFLFVNKALHGIILGYNLDKIPESGCKGD